MSFNYQVILKPSDVKFSCNEIPNKFNNGTLLTELLEKLNKGKILSKDIAAIEVVWDSEQWDWYALNNRRLWVFQEMEKAGKIHYVGMNRIELLDNNVHKSPKLYKTVKLYDPQWDVAVSNSDDELKETQIMSIDFDSLPKSKLSQSRKNQVPSKTTVKSSIKVLRETTTEVETLKEKDYLPLSLSKCYNQNISLDNISNVSRSSNVSSLSRNDRRISSKSGLFGYGYYHLYSTEYLSKIKADRNSSLKRYKPYNVISSNISGRRKLSTSMKRLELSERAGDKVKLSRNRRTRLYSNDIECDRPLSTVAYSDSDECYSGIKLSKLYAVWQQRRSEYLRTSRSAIMNGSISMYLCGLCFKKFHKIVDLQQHCEALMHYACITCGKFFASYASLGQHCQKLQHQKD